MNNKVGLRDIYDAINNLEAKIDHRFERLEARTDSVEDKVANLLGKVGIGVMVLAAVISSSIAFFFDFVKKK
jgi:hypothetical protein